MCDEFQDAGDVIRGSSIPGSFIDIPCLCHKSIQYCNSIHVKLDGYILACTWPTQSLAWLVALGVYLQTRDVLSPRPDWFRPQPYPEHCLSPASTWHWVLWQSDMPWHDSNAMYCCVWLDFINTLFRESRTNITLKRRDIIPVEGRVFMRKRGAPMSVLGAECTPPWPGLLHSLWAVDTWHWPLQLQPVHQLRHSSHYLNISEVLTSGEWLSISSWPQSKPVHCVSASICPKVGIVMSWNQV